MDPVIADQVIEFYEGEVAERAKRPLSASRLRAIDDYISALRERGASSLIEAGCGRTTALTPAGR